METGTAARICQIPSIALDGCTIVTSALSADPPRQVVIGGPTENRSCQRFATQTYDFEHLKPTISRTSNLRFREPQTYDFELCGPLSRIGTSVIRAHTELLSIPQQRYNQL